MCITCFQNGAFAWAARDLAPGGNKLQGRIAPILAESPPFPPLRTLTFGWLTLVFCSYTPIATPNQPKSPCDTLGSSTKSALCRFFFNPASHHYQRPQTLLLASFFSALTLTEWNSRIPLSSFVWGQECRYGRGSGHQTERCAKQAATLEFRSTQLSDMEVR